MDFTWDQVVDWRAVALAGALSSAVFLLTNLAFNAFYLGSFWLTWRILASVIMGPEVISPLEAGRIEILFTALLVHLPLSVAFTALIAVIVHEWGIWLSAVVGGLMGLALYAINFYGLSFLFPWIGSLTSWLMLVSHLAFGAVAGASYELFERRIYRLERAEA